ncbi:MAG: ATP-binding cassette domain-containing protein, partial [Alphaproteobacteria bacterium]|nr:ATP-binding cassette domain-containing protein [Alphaproteobacteria bacterium]
MVAPLLHLRDIRLSFGGSPLLDGTELAVAPRDRLCLVGRNGSGKSTLLKIAAGLIEPDSGTRFAQPGATIRYLPQEPDLSGYENSRAYVEAGLVEGDDPNRAFYLLGSLGLTGEEKPAALSGGEARRAALARVLAPRDRLCLVGRNGSGKSTLLKIAAGLIEPDSGSRFAQPGATIRYLPQEPDLSACENTRAYVEA